VVFAAARWHGAASGPYDGLRTVLLRRWDGVRTTAMSRATQTNEVGRCALVLPLLARLPGTTGTARGGGLGGAVPVWCWTATWKGGRHCLGGSPRSSRVAAST
jgi:Uncharacterized protein conserved in bacteria (DUF2332)